MSQCADRFGAPTSAVVRSIVTIVIAGSFGLGLLTAYGARAMEGPAGGENNPFAGAATDASANLFTGGLSVRVPIRIPPGRSQTTPDLALHYSSQGGLDVAGMGWSFPLGRITRRVKHGVPRCDGPHVDSFRLTLSTSSNVLVRASEDLFLLEVDEGYVEAIPDREENRWIVRTREGLTYVFGATESARVFAGEDVFLDEGTCSFTTAWAVTRVEDPNGNRIDIAYRKAGNRMIPRSIEYGGNESASISHPFRVRVETSSLDELGKVRERRFDRGVDQSREERIAAIVVEAWDGELARHAEVRRYSLHYDDSPPGASFLLDSVEATALPTRRFSYSTGRVEVEFATSRAVPPATPEGLGVHRRSGPRTSLMDMNGDGLVDQVDATTGGPGWLVSYGTTDPDVAFGPPEPWGWPSGPGLDDNRIQKLTGGVDDHLTLDLNGDGIPDLLRRSGDAIEVYPGRCDAATDCGFASSPELWNNPGGLSLRRADTGSRGTHTLRDVLDMNGDGLPDLVRAIGGNWEIHLNTGAGFEVVPVVYPETSDRLGFSALPNESARAEEQLIDLNGDGLPDWIRGVEHANPLGSNARIPGVYFAVDQAGQTYGPLFLDEPGFLCPVAGDDQAILCSSPWVLPQGWAIVGAVTVRLNTGIGLSEPIHSPAPFWEGGDERANRLRAAKHLSGSSYSFTYRDFVDVNGDGRVDWVTTGHAYDGSADWFVLYNLGNGRFGGGLEIVRPAGSTEVGVDLGEVRPRGRIADAGELIQRRFHHTQPADRTDIQMTFLDLDGDGFAERVSEWQSEQDEWNVWRLRFGEEGQPHRRPWLLTRIDDGLGGSTLVDYQPSTAFVSSGSEPSRLPFVAWLLTGIRRSDGLCDVEPIDPFRATGNPCLAAGHELVESVEYAEGEWDAVDREFRGFGRVAVTDGVGTRIERAFYQDSHRKGKLAVEDVYVGGVDLLTRTTHDWRVFSEGVRTQLYLQETRFEERVLYPRFDSFEDQCVVHRNSILLPGGGPDPQTRIREACSMACEGAGPSDALCTPLVPGKKWVETRFANPVPGANHPVWDRPEEIRTFFADESSTSRLSSETIFVYDELSPGWADRGNLGIERKRVSASPDRWVETRMERDTDGGAAGPGNILSVLVPIVDESREPTRTEYDGEFSLHPIREIAPSTLGASGDAIAHVLEKRFDLRFGAVRESVGVQGREAGDVSSTVFDLLGRPICVAEPGASCAGGMGASPTTEYVYTPGDPAATDPIDRLSSVEVRRREPRSPTGYLATRSYWDALGRERITTNEQFVVDPPIPGVEPEMRVVVARHLEYGPHGEVVRRGAPYVAGASLEIGIPSHVASESYRYVLNDNAEGYVDPMGRVGETLRFDGQTPRTYFFGRSVRIVDALEGPGGIGNHVQENLDAHGRVVSRDVFEGASTWLTRFEARYDGGDRVVEEWVGGDPTTSVRTGYDLLGRKIWLEDPDSGLWTTRYDDAGNVVHEDDPMPGQSIQTCHDALHRVVLRCARASDVFAPGLCSSAAPVCESSFAFDYDESDPALWAASGEHAKGRLTRVTGDGYRKDLAYDLRGRRVEERVEILGVTAQTSYVHAPDVDRLIEMTYPDGEVVGYGYDASGQPVSLAEKKDGVWTASYVQDIHYDLRGMPVEVVRGNYTVDEFVRHGPEEGFQLRRLVSRPHTTGSMLPLRPFLDLSYTAYDGNSRLLSVRDELHPSGPLSMSARYDYDGAGRLTDVSGARSERFEYDPIGNMTVLGGEEFFSDTAGGSAMAPHRFDRIGEAEGLHWQLASDANGRRSVKRRSDGSETRVFGYDAFGGLATITRNDVTKRFGYDADLQRTHETLDGVTRRFYGAHAESDGSLLIKAYYIGSQLIATRADADPQLAREDAAATPLEMPPSVYWALCGVALALLVVPIGRERITLGIRVAPSGPLGMVVLLVSVGLPLAFGTGCTGPQSIRHYHSNHLGSPVAISKFGAQLERQLRYSAYGVVDRFDATGEPVAIDRAMRWEFGGYVTDPETELQYANARYYDPSEARFLSLDPERQFASPYAYAGWDPVNFVDPTGELAFELIGLILLALAVWVVVGHAIATGVRAGAEAGFQALGIGLAGLAVGTLLGLTAPAALAAIPGVTEASVQATLSTLGVGSSVYGVATAEGTQAQVFAGVGLALSLAGAAHALHQGFGSSGGGAAGPPTRRTPRPDGAAIAGGDETANAQALAVAQRSYDPGDSSIQPARPPALARVRGRITIDVEANQELTILVTNPHPTGAMVRVTVGLPAPGGGVYAPETFGGYVGPLGGTVSGTVSALGTPPVAFRVLFEVPGALGVWVRFTTRGPVPGGI